MPKPKPLTSLLLLIGVALAVVLGRVVYVS